MVHENAILVADLELPAAQKREDVGRESSRASSKTGGVGGPTALLKASVSPIDVLPCAIDSDSRPKGMIQHKNGVALWRRLVRDKRPHSQTWREPVRTGLKREGLTP